MGVSVKGSSFVLRSECDCINPRTGSGRVARAADIRKRAMLLG
jgi:hypothetical protein